MKQLKPTNLIAVEIAGKIKVTQFTNGIFYQEPQPSIDIDYKPLKIKYPKNTKFLGEVTKEGIQFDIEPYIEKLRWSKPYHDLFSIVGVNKEDSVWWTNNPKESFQSLLQANNVEIPEGNKLLILLKQ